MSATEEGPHENPSLSKLTFGVEFEFTVFTAVEEHLLDDRDAQQIYNQRRTPMRVVRRMAEYIKTKLDEHGEFKKPIVVSQRLNKPPNCTPSNEETHYESWFIKTDPSVTHSEPPLNAA